ncbi:hypothetical protein KP509_1Z154800 [Ceratopteris richardii]|nr:hypothetical protein KP509_1Z154800 [Ceratopteris richardii]
MALLLLILLLILFTALISAILTVAFMSFINQAQPIPCASAPSAAATAPVNLEVQPVPRASAPLAAATAPVNLEVQPVPRASAPPAAATAPVNLEVQPVPCASAPLAPVSAPVNLDAVPCASETLAPVSAPVKSCSACWSYAAIGLQLIDTGPPIEAACCGLLCSAASSYQRCVLKLGLVMRSLPDEHTKFEKVKGLIWLRMQKFLPSTQEKRLGILVSQIWPPAIRRVLRESVAILTVAFMSFINQAQPIPCASAPSAAATAPVNLEVQPVPRASAPLAAATAPVNLEVQPVPRASAPPAAATAPVNLEVQPVPCASAPLAPVSAPVNLDAVPCASETLAPVSAPVNLAAPAVRSRSVNYNARRVVFCGHSVGGALAHLALVKYMLANASRLEHDAEVAAIAFGAPHVCDEEAREYLSGHRLNIERKIYNFVSLSDPVPFLLKSLPYARQTRSKDDIETTMIYRLCGVQYPQFQQTLDWLKTHAVSIPFGRDINQEVIIYIRKLIKVIDDGNFKEKARECKWYVPIGNLFTDGQRMETDKAGGIVDKLHDAVLDDMCHENWRFSDEIPVSNSTSNIERRHQQVSP